MKETKGNEPSKAGFAPCITTYIPRCEKGIYPLYRIDVNREVGQTQLLKNSVKEEIFEAIPTMIIEEVA